MGGDMNDKVRELRRASAQNEFIERIRAQTVLAEKLLSALLLVNGGAMIGLFTFIGNLQKKGAGIVLDTSLLWLGFWGFIVGMIAALMAFAMSFLSQHHYTLACQYEIMRHDDEALDGSGSNAREREAVVIGTKFYGAGILLSFLSILAFLVGSGFSLAGVLPA